MENSVHFNSYAFILLFLALQTCILYVTATDQESCGDNEEYRKVVIPCPSDRCEDSIKRLSSCPASILYRKYCKGGYVCSPGYFRNNDNKCVPLDQCPDPGCCPEGEVLSFCPPKNPCNGEYCPTSECAKQTCSTPKECGRPQCICAFNRHRDRKTGKCILTKDCPPFQCNGPNEEYQSCSKPCPGEKCEDYLNNEGCPKYRIVVPCKPQCKCKKGYYRNKNNVCVPACQCEA